MSRECRCAADALRQTIREIQEILGHKSVQMTMPAVPRGRFRF